MREQEQSEAPIGDYGQGGYWEAEGSGQEPRGLAGQVGYEQSDERIRGDVCERLTRHGQIDPSDIEVKVSNRKVTLSGSVPNRQTERMAEEVARAVSGVSEVHNQLRLTNPG